VAYSIDELPDGIVVIGDDGLSRIRTRCGAARVVLRHTHHDVVGQPLFGIRTVIVCFEFPEVSQEDCYLVRVTHIESKPVHARQDTGPVIASNRPSLVKKALRKLSIPLKRTVVKETRLI
jgi:hypothetical protein